MFKSALMYSTCCLLAIAVLGCGDATSSAAPGQVSNPAATLYNQSCISCHSSGAAGAPKAHDISAWQPRLEKGMETLLEHTKKGIAAMPPMGMCMQCSDEQLRSLIEFMSSSQ